MCRLLPSSGLSCLTGSTPMNREIACNGQILYKDMSLHSPENLLLSAANSIFHSLLCTPRTKDFRIAACVSPSWLHPHQPSQTSARPHLPKGSGTVLLCSRQAPPYAHQTRCPNGPLSAPCLPTS